MLSSRHLQILLHARITIVDPIFGGHGFIVPTLSLLQINRTVGILDNNKKSWLLVCTAGCVLSSLKNSVQLLFIDLFRLEFTDASSFKKSFNGFVRISSSPLGIIKIKFLNSLQFAIPPIPKFRNFNCQFGVMSDQNAAITGDTSTCCIRGCIRDQI